MIIVYHRRQFFLLEVEIINKCTKDTRPNRNINRHIEGAIVSFIEGVVYVVCVCAPLRSIEEYMCRCRVVPFVGNDDE